MPEYKAPLDDMRFVLNEVWDASEWRDLPGADSLDADLVDALLEEAAKLCETVAAPLNHSGDEEGCRFQDGEVHTPQGFREAYRTFAEAGWPGLTASPDYGGQGLPETVGTLVLEMLAGANLAFSTYPGLTYGAANAIERHAGEELRRRWLPPMAEGRYCGTMCLTEAHCGTDLGLVRSRTVARDDGSYALTGTKVFISAGEHDLSENIVHLVLARLPDAPPGIKGLSLFLVPKFLPGEDGAPGARNTVRCARIEHKMGLRASATCELVFEGATGWLVGEPNKGMRAMFTMMNAARLAVGVQGVGIATAAYQAAAAYARERRQGRSLDPRRRSAEADADPILVHPDVRRALLTMRAYAEGGRALEVWVANRLDVARRHREPAVREAAEDFVSLMTPIVKAFLTDLGVEAASLGIQVWGGHGYIRDNGVEQYLRDVRICPIYEGTNGVQALDLVGRKLSAHAGRMLRGFFHPVRAWLDENARDAPLAEFVGPLAKGFGRLQSATARIAEVGLARPGEAAGVAGDYLRLFGWVAMGYAWARMAEAALRAQAPGAAPAAAPVFYRAKLETARFFMRQLLPRSGALLSAIMAGGAALEAFPDEAF